MTHDISCRLPSARRRAAPSAFARPSAPGAAAALTAVALLTAAPSAHGAEPSGADWPEFHGSRRDNLSPETGLLPRWPAGGPRLLWKSADCGKGYASVSIAEGRLFTSGDFGDEEKVVALDLDGRPVWKAANGPAWKGTTPGARSTPTWRDGLVYHMNPTGRLAAFRASSGDEVWAVDPRDRFDVDHGAWAMSESVVVDGDAVIFAPGGKRGRIAALDRRSGKTLWANTEIREGAAYCSPIVVTHDGVRQVITVMRRSVVGVDVRTGKLLWSHAHRTPYDMNVTTPVYRDGLIFVTGGYGAGGRLLRIGPRSESVSEAWAGGDLDNCHAGVVLLGDSLYGSGCRQSEKGFICVDFLTGKTRWTDREVWKVTPTHADGKLYCLGHEGRMMLVEADPKGCRIVSSFDLPSSDKYDCLAHPVVRGGRLYVRQGPTLLAYDVRGK